MKNLIIVISLFFCGFSVSQISDNQIDEWGLSGNYQRLFNINTIKTVSGEIIKIEPFSPNRLMCNGVHILIRTDERELSVHLGPQWFVDEQTIVLRYGMPVNVKGSMIKFDGTSVMIAIEVVTEEGVIKLRKSDGTPYWSRRLSSKNNPTRCSSTGLKKIPIEQAKQKTTDKNFFI